MTGKSGKRSWKTSLGIVLVAAIVAAAGTLPVLAERTQRVGPEIKQGGLTVAELAARRMEISQRVSALVPASVANERLDVGITQQDRDLLAAPHVPDGTAPLRIGVVKPVAASVGKPFMRDFGRGVIESSPDGSFVWAMEVSSPGAQAIRIHLTGFYLPDDTEMYLLGPNGQADGPYTGDGRNGNGDFWTRSIDSDVGQLVLHYTGTTPASDRPEMSFFISDVAHIRGRPPKAQERNHDSWPCSNNAPCVVDATCINNVNAIVDAKDAVAKMEWIRGAFVNTCSGGLLADTDLGSQIPYFLTANHCITSSNSSLETFFNYTTDSCNGGCPDGLVTGGTPPSASTVGFTVLRTASSSDYTLGTLDQAPPAGAVFLGWNNTPVANSNGASLYRISNANFGPQVYSQHDVDTGSPTCTGIPRGGWIYSKDITGATMGGSSGSPVVNGAGEVVGQLTGCCGFNCGNECDAGNNWTIDGAFAAYFADVDDLLDPQTGGCTTDPECDDGLFCTGTETCGGGSCQSSGDPCGAGETCNEGTETCDGLPAGCGDGACGAGEDCISCPADCRQKTNGNPNSRYCCDGDLSDCGDSRCNESGWVCGGGGTCTSDPECDDGQFCNGAETCNGGSCQAGSDPCPGAGCDEPNDVCTGSCGVNKDTCDTNADCCSNNCRNGACKGN